MLASGTPEQRLSCIASLQRGRVARRQLIEAGISASSVGRMVKRGLLHREHAGVYAVVDATPRPLSRETAALLACGDRSVLSHRSAAALWGLVGGWDGPVEVLIAMDTSKRRRPGVIIRRATRLLARDVRLHQRLPVTSPARTLLDLAAVASARELERAVDEALVVLKLVDQSELEDVLSRTPNHKGARILSELLETRGPARITQSEAERLFLDLIRRAGLPIPETQVKLGRYTVDFYWPEHKVAFEIDGYRFHTSRSAFDRDRSKDAAAKAAGIDPNRVSRDQVKDEPLRVVAYVAHALGRAIR